MAAIVAGCPVWEEHELTVARARASVQPFGIPFFTYEGGVAHGKNFKTQAEMRQHGLTLAWKAHRAEWYLQLDADERLRNAELLAPILEGCKWNAHPLPLLQEDGSLLLAPFKLVSTNCGATRIVACAEYFQFNEGGSVYCLAGYTAPEELRDNLLQLPYLEHCPSDRPPSRRSERLSEDEPWLEPRPTSAVQWPLPPLTLQGGVMKENDGAIVEYEKGDGTHYCPGCGKRYDTPGICTGNDESGHAPVNVVKVSGGAVDEVEFVDPEEVVEPEPKPKRKPSSRKKSTTTSRKKTTTTRRRKS